MDIVRGCQRDRSIGRTRPSLHLWSSYALSPHAKGTGDRPWQWLQDRIRKTCFFLTGKVNRKNMIFWSERRPHSIFRLCLLYLA